MLSPLKPKRDLRLSGLVIYTGRSSMEVVLKMESIGGGQPDEPVMIGMFVLPTIFLPFLISSLSRSLLYGLPERRDQQSSESPPAYHLNSGRTRTVFTRST
jgi:hypothetical protein